MSVTCPAETCDFTGMVDQVEGHIGGVADEAHRGVTVSSLQESLHGKASEGLRVGLLLLVVGAVVVVWYYYQQKEESAETEESAGAEGFNQGELVAPAGGADA